MRANEKKKRAAAAKAKPKKETTLLQFFERVYLPEYMGDKKPSYRQAYCRSLDRFTAFNRGDCELSTITSETFKAYRDWHMECNRGAPSTAYGDIVRIRRVVVAAGRCDLRGVKAQPSRPKAEAGKILPTDVQKFYTEVYRVHRNVSLGYDEQIRISLKSLRKFHGKPIVFSELADRLNRWIAWLELRLSPRTIKSKRAAVISLWYAASEMGVCEPPNTRLIRRPKIQRPTPDAWSLDEMRAILAACKEFNAEFYSNGISRGRFWDAFVRVCYDTALRRGDMLAVCRSQIEPINGGHVLRSMQNKTGDGIVHLLRPSTVLAVEAIFPPDRKLVFEWLHTPWTFHDHWRDVLDRAGLDPWNRRNGVQKIRRTSASHLERTNPGTATAHLGHRSGDMARQHYLDPKISRGDLPLPPSID